MSLQFHEHSMYYISQIFKRRAPDDIEQVELELVFTTLEYLSIPAIIPPACCAALEKGVVKSFYQQQTRKLVVIITLAHQ